MRYFFSPELVQTIVTWWKVIFDLKTWNNFTVFIHSRENRVDIIAWERCGPKNSIFEWRYGRTIPWHVTRGLQLNPQWGHNRLEVLSNIYFFWFNFMDIDLAQCSKSYVQFLNPATDKEDNVWTFSSESIKLLSDQELFLKMQSINANFFSNKYILLSRDSKRDWLAVQKTINYWHSAQNKI